MEPDMGSKSRLLPTPRAFDAPARGSPSKYYHDVCYEKTRMIWLPDGDKNFDITVNHFHRIHERDRQTDGQTDTT